MIECFVKIRMNQQRLEFRSKQKQSVIQQGVIKRLDSQMITRHEQRLPVTIPYTKSKHAVKTFYTMLTPFFPGMHNHFRITMRAKLMSQSCQLICEFPEIIDFTIKYNDNTAILIE